MNDRSDPAVQYPRFVGRGAELATIARAIDDAVAGRPVAVLVSGEPGVGKSRLVDEASAAAAERSGARVLRGFALESGGMPAYFPLARALGPALRSAWTEGGGIASLLPVLAAAGIAPPGATLKPPPRLAADAERLRLFEALVAVCAALAEQSPQILALDDLQWAEPAVWEAIVYLARAIAPAPVTLLLAVREEALADAAGPTARAAAELNRQRLLARVPLRRLTQDEVAVLAAGVLAGSVAEDLVEQLARRSEGNPFFAEEILRDLIERGVLGQTPAGWTLAGAEALAAVAALPPTLRLAIDQRLQRLPEETRTVLSAAAVLGPAFADRTLAAMLGWERGRLDQALAAARAAGIVAGGSEGWRFAHDTIRETIDAAAGGERRRLHAAAAAAIAGAAGPAPDLPALAALVYHWRLADEPGRAAAAAIQASLTATALHATAEALAHARVGVELQARAEQAGAPAQALAALQLTHGEAALAAGEYAEAEVALREALAAAQLQRDRAQEGLIWARLGALYRRREAPDEAAGCLRTALSLLDDGVTDSVEVAETLIELAGLEGLTRARYSEAAALGERALALAGRLQRPTLEASAALALANSVSREGNAVEVRPLLRRALERALAGDAPALAAEICATLANACYWAGELGASQRYAERRLALAQRAGDLFGLRHAHSWLALLAWGRGEWETARTLLREAEPVLARLDSPEPLAFLRLVEGLIEYRTGGFTRAFDLIGEALHGFERVDPATLVWYAGWLPLTCLALGQTDEARRLLAAQEARLAALSETALPARSARNLQALAYAKLGDRQQGAACEAALRPFAADYHWSPVRRSLAALAALRGDRETALADLTAAEALARREQMRPDLALILLARAALLPGADRDRARHEQEARGLLLALHMTHDLLRPAAVRGGSRNAGGLSEREVQVLRLVAQGQTNRQIAAALVISERTVINHLSHSYAKIGVDNRAGATAYAHRQGLV